ncbi:Protein MMS22-like protein, partial [Stegodyphus mimosarum]
MQPPSDSMQELTSKTLQQNEILNCFPLTKNLMFGIADHVYLSIKFFRTIGETYDKCKSFQEKTLLKNKVQHYFKNFVPCIAARIRHECSAQVLDHIYQLASHLVEYCSPVLHTSGGESILAQLLDRSVFPHTIFPKDKTLQSILSCSIKEYLPSYFRGLFKLDYRNDKCIEREIKDLLVHYTGLYLAANNPITKLCMNTVLQNPEGLSLDAFHFILDLVGVYILSKKTSNTLNGFEICYEIFKIAPSTHIKEIVTVILKNAMELYMKHNDSLSEYLWKLMRKMFACFKEKLDLAYVKSLLIPILEWFVLEKLQWSTARGFSVLDSITEFLPEVISDIVPFLSKSIEVLEKNRGLGEDMLLRGGLRNTIAKLQK